ncbi:diguanylate cyclase domain-containing protein [Nocardia sp. NPDC004123]
MNDAGQVAGLWWRALTDRGWSADRELLGQYAAEVITGVAAEEFEPGVGARVGAALADLGLTDPDVPLISARVLYTVVDHGAESEAGQRLAAVLAALGSGHRARSLDIRHAAAPDAGGPAREPLSPDVYRIMFEHVSVAAAIGEVDGTLLVANKRFTDLIGIPSEIVHDISVFDHSHPDDRDDILAAVFEKLVPARGGALELEHRFFRADGSMGWAAFKVTYIQGAPGDRDYLLTVGEDVTERHRLQEELHRQARHDPLTGLSNRRHLLERIDAMIDSSVPDDQAGLCFIDLDRFKYVNDRYGHGVGDQVLVAVAARLWDGVGDERCTVARLGGDEFVVLVPPPAGGRRVAAVADRLLSALSEPVEVGGHRLAVSASIGAVVTPAMATDAETLLDAADASLYQAKTHALGQVVLHTVHPGPGPTRPLL